jgi:hypothetical protein
MPLPATQGMKASLQHLKDFCPGNMPELGKFHLYPENQPGLIIIETMPTTGEMSDKPSADKSEKNTSIKNLLRFSEVPPMN